MVPVGLLDTVADAGWTRIQDLEAIITAKSHPPRANPQSPFRGADSLQSHDVPLRRFRETFHRGDDPLLVRWIEP